MEMQITEDIHTRIVLRGLILTPTDAICISKTISKLLKSTFNKKIIIHIEGAFAMGSVPIRILTSIIKENKEKVFIYVDNDELYNFFDEMNIVKELNIKHVKRCGSTSQNISVKNFNFEKKLA